MLSPAMVATPEELVPPLLDWYRVHGRDLPWRRSPTPYRILLSELLCQQTRIQTALPYYERFLARWPTLDDLAGASEDDVLEMWAGLGYYRRARALHAAARAASALGGLPATVEGLRALPGIGPYTAGAIASIAFGEPAAAVDGNVERVLGRVDRGPELPWNAAGKRHLQRRARSLHDGRRPGDHAGDLTQALMELGASLCSPTTPSCQRCPLAAHCEARAHGEQDAWPRMRPRKQPVPIAAAVALVEDRGALLFARRPPKGLLAGLWEPVMVPVPGPDDATAGALAEGVAQRVGLSVEVGARLGTVVHVFSHRKLTARVFAARTRGGDLSLPEQDGAYVDARFASPGAEPPLSTLARKLVALRDATPLLMAAEP